MNVVFGIPKVQQNGDIIIGALTGRLSFFLFPSHLNLVTGCDPGELGPVPAWTIMDEWKELQSDSGPSYSYQTTSHSILAQPRRPRRLLPTTVSSPNVPNRVTYLPVLFIAILIT